MTDSESEDISRASGGLETEDCATQNWETGTPEEKLGTPEEELGSPEEELSSPEAIHLEPEQQAFLSRLVELGADERKTSQSLASARLNFGLQEADMKSVPCLERSVRRVLKPRMTGDKGYLGVVAQTTRTTDRHKRRRKDRPERKANSTLALSIEDGASAFNIRDNLELSLKSKPSSEADQSKGIDSLTESFIIPPLGISKGLEHTPAPFTLPNLASTITQLPSLGLCGPSRPQFTLPSSLCSLAIQPGLAQGLLAGQPCLAQGSLAGQSGLAQGLLASQSGLAQGLLASQPGLAQGSLASQSGLAQGSLASQPGLAQGSLASQSGLAQGSLGGLGLLANLHLSSVAKSPFLLPNLGAAARTTESTLAPVSSLNSLASLHLASNTTLPTRFTLPLIAPPEELRRDPPTPEPEIDLTSAIRLHASPEPETSTSPEPGETETKILLSDLTNLRSNLLLHRPSPFGKVVSKRWRRVVRRKDLLIATQPEGLSRFQFSDPSPDDIVKKAQTQSRSFLSRS